MQDLFDQERPLSPSLIRFGVSALGILLSVVAIFVVLMAFGTLLSGAVVPAIIQAASGLALTLFAFLIVRILSEILFALHRLNDRTGLLSEDLRATQTEMIALAAAKKTAAPARRTPQKRIVKKPAAKPTAKSRTPSAAETEKDQADDA